MLREKSHRSSRRGRVAVCRTTTGSEAHVNTAVRISASLGLHDFEQHTTTGRNASSGIVTVMALADDVHEPVAVGHTRTLHSPAARSTMADARDVYGVRIESGTRKSGCVREMTSGGRPAARCTLRRVRRVAPTTVPVSAMVTGSPLSGNAAMVGGGELEDRASATANAPPPAGRRGAALEPLHADGTKAVRTIVERTRVTGRIVPLGGLVRRNRAHASPLCLHLV